MKKVFFSLALFSQLIVLTSCDNSNNTDLTKVEESMKKTNIGSSDEIVEINGVKHFVKKIGEGEPLLVLHGGPGLSHNYLVPHFKKLAQKYQVIFYDQRGCGQTEFPTETSSITIDNYIEDLEVLRIHLKLDKVNLVGHSWGSLLAMRYAKKYPNKLKRLILISPVPGNSDYFEKTFSNMQHKRSEDDTKELVATMMSTEFKKREDAAFRKAILLGDKVNLADQEKVAELYEPMSFNITSANNLMLVNSLLEKTYFNFNVIDGLNIIECPTLIVVGDLDNVPFASTQEINENIIGSKLEVIKNSCHYPFFESPKEFNHTIKNFLAPEYEQ